MTDLTLFLKRLKAIALSDNERLALRERLAAYADMHPALTPAGRAGASVLSVFSIRHFTAYAFSLLLLIGAGGGITLAANTSVPGDSLYSLKIHIAEPLESALAPTAEDQARVAATIATRRVDEAVTLAARGELTPARNAYLSQQFDASIKTAAVKADALASTGNATAAATVKANLAADLAGEAQALGAVTTNDSKQSASLLRTVVATSESITDSDGGSTVVAVNAVSVANAAAAAAATTTAPAAPANAARLHAAFIVQMKQAATSTDPLRQPHFGKLRSDQTFASTTLAVPTLTAPKTDAAIPQKPQLPAHAATATGIELRK